MTTKNLFLNRIGQLRMLLRFRSFDVSTESGRSQERYRRIAHTAVAQALSRVVTIAASLMTVPLTINYLGQERYGMWLTLSSFIAMLSFADLGLGNGVLTTISAAHGKNDRELARRVLSSATAILTAMAVLVLVVFVPLYPFLKFEKLFNVHDSLAVAEAGPAFAAMIVCFAANVPFGIVQRARMGFQEGVAANIWAMSGNILQVLLLLLVIYLKGGLLWLVFAMAGGPLLATVVSTVSFFGFEKPWLMPRRADIDRATSWMLLRTGVMFLILQIAGSLAFTSDNIVIAQVLEPEAVTAYAVPMRLFGVITTITGIVLQPLWPAYGEAIARGDVPWIRRTLNRTMLMSILVASGLSAVLVAFGPWIIDLWIGKGKVNPTFWLLLGMGVWSVLSAMGNCIAMLLNGCNKLVAQVTCAVFLGVVGVGLKIVLASTAAGISGVIWGTVSAYILCAAIPLGLIVPRLLREMSEVQVSTNHVPTPASEEFL